MEYHNISVEAKLADSYCERLAETNRPTRRVFSEISDDHPISVSMACLYRVSTCQDFCRGGDHRIENICGRAWNNASAALTLISIGYYDEALSLCRSLHEIANLFALFVLDEQSFRDWATSSKKERMNKFSPYRVRRRIEEIGKMDVPIKQESYQILCEAATHVTPDTAPNSFNGQKHVGPKLQEKGQADCLSHLSEALPYIAMIGTKITGNEDAFNEIAKHAGRKS